MHTAPRYDLSVTVTLHKTELPSIFALKNKCNLEDVTVGGVTYRVKSLKFAAFVGSATRDDTQQYIGTLNFFFNKDGHCEPSSFNSINHKG